GGLGIGRDCVDVRRIGREGDRHALAVRIELQLREQELGAFWSLVLQNRIKRVEPLFGFGGVAVSVSARNEFRLHQNSPLPLLDGPFCSKTRAFYYSFYRARKVHPGFLRDDSKR